MIFKVLTLPEYISLTVASVCLVTAVIMDIRKQEVYDLVWMVMLTSGLILLMCESAVSIAVLLSLGFYFFFQERIMAHFYGKADCHAFCACSLVYAAFGCELEYYALQMMVTWCMLAVFQLARKNVTRCGKLRKNVPMIPYIAAGFFVVLVIP